MFNLSAHNLECLTIHWQQAYDSQKGPVWPTDEHVSHFLLALETGLLNNQKLNCLRLADFHIYTDNQAMTLGKTLQSFSLEELVLWQLSLQGTHAAILASALSKNTTLKKLYLHENCIEESGTIHLAKILTNKPLKIVDLGGNRITSKGAYELIRSLEKSNDAKLILQGNDIDLKTLQEMLKLHDHEIGTPTSYDLDFNEGYYRKAHDQRNPQGVYHEKMFIYNKTRVYL